MGDKSLSDEDRARLMQKGAAAIDRTMASFFEVADIFKDLGYEQSLKEIKEVLGDLYITSQLLKRKTQPSKAGEKP